MSDTTELLDQHERRAPAWVHQDPVTREPSGNAAGCSAETAAKALLSMEPLDRQLFVLSHGLSFRLGPISYATRTDPALIPWHLARALNETASDLSVKPDDLEASIHALLTQDELASTAPSPPSEEGPSWRADDLLSHFADDEITRLTARVVHNIDANTLEERRPGLGVGAIAFVGIVVAAFMIYGALRDVNPIWQATRLMQLEKFTEARRVLSDYARTTRSPEASTMIVLCLLAEGEFEEAFEQLDAFEEVNDGRDANHPLGAFRPNEDPLVFIGGAPECAALLPRGLITTPRPQLVFRGGEAGAITLDLIPKVGTDAPLRTQRAEQEASIPGEIVRIDYPEAWAPIPAGAARWSAPDSDCTAAFTILEPTRTRKLMNRARLGLPPATPLSSQFFLRGHFYLRHELYQQAAEQFARLALMFPDRVYPLDQLDAIATALGVDRSVFLR